MVRKKGRVRICRLALKCKSLIPRTEDGKFSTHSRLSIILFDCSKNTWGSSIATRDLAAGKRP